jgi:hypothetical protein
MSQSDNIADFLLVVSVPGSRLGEVMTYLYHADLTTEVRVIDGTESPVVKPAPKPDSVTPRPRPHVDRRRGDRSRPSCPAFIRNYLEVRGATTPETALAVGEMIKAGVGLGFATQTISNNMYNLLRGGLISKVDGRLYTVTNAGPNPGAVVPGTCRGTICEYLELRNAYDADHAISTADLLNATAAAGYTPRTAANYLQSLTREGLIGKPRAGLYYRSRRPPVATPEPSVQEIVDA